MYACSVKRYVRSPVRRWLEFPDEQHPEHVHLRRRGHLLPRQMYRLVLPAYIISVSGIVQGYCAEMRSGYSCGTVSGSAEKGMASAAVHRPISRKNTPKLMPDIADVPPSAARTHRFRIGPALKGMYVGFRLKRLITRNCLAVGETTGLHLRILTLFTSGDSYQYPCILQGMYHPFIYRYRVPKPRHYRLMVQQASGTRQEIP